MSAARIATKSKSQEEFIKIFSGICKTESPWQAWSDFVECSAIAISQKADRRTEREERYLSIAKKYGAGMNKFPELFACMVESMDENQEQDFLGDTFMRLELGSHFHGQFFTPYDVSRMMGEMMAEECVNQIQENGWCKINDPACGAGAMLVAARNALKNMGVDWPEKALFVGQDISKEAAMMCYIQSSLMGCAGYVIVGNTLTSRVGTSDGVFPVANGDTEIWLTPALMVNPAWKVREIIGRAQNETH